MQRHRRLRNRMAAIGWTVIPLLNQVFQRGNRLMTAEHPVMNTGRTPRVPLCGKRSIELQVKPGVRLLALGVVRIDGPPGVLLLGIPPLGHFDIDLFHFIGAGIAEHGEDDVGGVLVDPTIDLALVRAERERLVSPNLRTRPLAVLLSNLEVEITFLVNPDVLVAPITRPRTHVRPRLHIPCVTLPIELALHCHCRIQNEKGSDHRKHIDSIAQGLSFWHGFELSNP